MTERLQKILSARGMASRRKAEELIRAGLRRLREGRAGVPAEYCCSARPILCSLAFDR